MSENINYSEYCYGEFPYYFGANHRNVSAKKSNFPHVYLVLLKCVVCLAGWTLQESDPPL